MPAETDPRRTVRAGLGHLPGPCIRGSMYTSGGPLTRNKVDSLGTRQARPGQARPSRAGWVQLAPAWQGLIFMSLRARVTQVHGESIGAGVA
jgi:hypothetical protein